MSSVGLNKWIVSGHLASDAITKTVELKDGRTSKVAEVSLYVRKPRSREDSFLVRLHIWEKSAAWGSIPYLKKGSVVICTGTLDVSPFISNNGNVPKAGLEMIVMEIHLDYVKNEEAEALPAEARTELLV
jgi:single-stranded DNA-binding protein